MKTRRKPRAFARFAPFYWFFAGAPGLHVFAALAFMLLCFSAAKPELTRTLRVMTYDFISPALHVAARPVNDVAALLNQATGLAQLQSDNTRLARENTVLKDWHQRALSLEAENKYLREMLRLVPDPQKRYISARVLSDSGSSFVKTLLVTAGTAHGAEKDQAALAGGGLIGRVVEAGTDHARILLVTDANSRVPVLLENTRQHAVLSGQNDYAPVLSYLPPDTVIQSGTRVVTSGYGGVFPPGLPIGRVIPGQDGQHRVQLFSDFTRLTHVQIVDAY